jgi:hypothetical protein
MQLQVHLENEQCITFDADNPNILHQLTSDPDDTHLTAFFKANKQYPEACQLLYSEIPLYFTWDSQLKKW